MDKADRSRAGSVWTERGGRRHIEACRMSGPADKIEEVQLSPEDAPALRGWYTAAEIAALGLVPAGGAL